ncbi:MAG TPA: translation elongation factor Ts [Phycisphaerales bacterium]|nr:translation elongation factor Ts [Phycisphaerales bacterium]
MAEISATDVMKLRNQTGLSMMECKRAMVEAGGDLLKAEDILRKSMKGKMDTKVDRVAGEGRIAVAVSPNGDAATIVELRAETDFTAKNEKFIAVTDRVAHIALAASSGDVPVMPEMTRMIDELRISTGENVSYARGHKVSGAQGKTAFGSYVHHDGKKGVLLVAEGDVNDQTLRNICMHIVAAVPTPKGVNAQDVPADIVERERKFRVEQAMESGKPKEIAEKMVEGGMRKFYEEVALVEQPFVMDPTKKVRDIVGPKATIIEFFRFQVGETAR